MNEYGLFETQSQHPIIEPEIESYIDQQSQFLINCETTTMGAVPLTSYTITEAMNEYGLFETQSQHPIIEPDRDKC